MMGRRRAAEGVRPYRAWRKRKRRGNGGRFVKRPYEHAGSGVDYEARHGRGKPRPYERAGSECAKGAIPL